MDIVSYMLGKKAGGGGNVKIFSSIAEMNADSDKHEGDLAIVYSSTFQNTTENSVFSKATFPDTVVLQGESDGGDFGYSEVNSSIFSYIGGWLDPSSYNFLAIYNDTGNRIQITYSSEDGLTYVRTDNNSEEIDFGVNITYDPSIGFWWDDYGRFIQTEAKVFSGVYEAQLINNVLTYVLVSKLQNKQITITENGVQTISADSGNYGLGTVSVTTNVSNDEYFLENPKISQATIKSYIKEIPSDINFTGVNSINGMFSECINLESVPSLNLLNVNDMRNAFSYCYKIASIPPMDTSKVTKFSYLFAGCSKLVTIPLLNTSNLSDGNSMQSMVSSCPLLSEESLNNILAMCINATNITSNKTLKYIGLSSTQANTCTTLSNYQNFVDAGWTTGY